jgi:micrococcal nuclease
MARSVLLPRAAKALLAVLVVALTGLVAAATAWFVVQIAAGSLLFLRCGDGCSQPDLDTTGGAAIVVTDVVDGDTITVKRGATVARVRLLGIDTPETKDPRTEVQCYGREATAATVALLPPGTEVRLEGDVETRDRYDRLLAYVYRSSDGLFVNLELARLGFADLLTYPPNVAHTSELTAAVETARREQLGLWSVCGRPGQPAG